MPYESEHAARIRQPLPYTLAVFGRKSIAPGIDIITQRSKEGGSMEVQSYRFKKRQHTSTEAKSWLKEHSVKYIMFEPAGSINQESRKEIISRISKELSGALV